MSTALETASTVRVGRKSFAFTSLEQVSESYRATIDRLGLGASNTPKCDIIDARGDVIAHVSYNGRVWRGHRNEWKSGATPIYDPR